MVRGSIPTSGIISGDFIPVPLGCHSKTIRGGVFAQYGNLFTDNTYEKFKTRDTAFMRRKLRQIVKNSFRTNTATYGRVIIDTSIGLQTELEQKRRRIIRTAQAFDLKYPMVMWCTMRVGYNVKDAEIEFYPTMESLLNHELYGTCRMEEFGINGAMRIYRPGELVRIFRVTHIGVPHYRQMLFNPVSQDRYKQNRYMFVILAVNKGWLVNPGHTILSKNQMNFRPEKDGFAANFGARYDGDSTVEYKARQDLNTETAISVQIDEEDL